MGLKIKLVGVLIILFGAFLIVYGTQANTVDSTMPILGGFLGGGGINPMVYYFIGGSISVVGMLLLLA